MKKNKKRKMIRKKRIIREVKFLERKIIIGKERKIMKK